MTLQPPSTGNDETVMEVRLRGDATGDGDIYIYNRWDKLEKFVSPVITHVSVFCVCNWTAMLFYDLVYYSNDSGSQDTAF